MPHEQGSRGGISVVVPLYNHANYIEEAIRSVFRQRLKPAEVIVVDDGSTDASAEVMARICQAHPEVVFWSHPNQGAHHTINTGIHRATGEFVAILNSDDAYHPDRFSECLKIFERHPDVAAVATGLAFLDDAGRKIDNPWYEQSKAFYAESRDLALALINGNFFMTTSNLIVRRSVFQEIGYFSALRYTHDLDFFLRLLAREKQVYFLDEPLLSYRIHPSNTIREDHSKVRAEWAAVTAFFLQDLWRSDRSDWSYLKRVSEITSRHNLNNLLMFFFAHYAKSRETRLDPASFLRDEELCQFMHEAAK